MSCSCESGHAARRGAATGPMADPFPVPAYPPREWFYERPEWLPTPEEAMRAHVAAGGAQADAPVLKLLIDDEGRAAGYFQEFGQCLVHDHGACPQASPTGHSAFHQGSVVVEDGSQIPVGIIANVGGHADPYATVSVALDHYADPDKAIVVGRAYDDEHGSYVLGSVVPWATYADVAKARMHPLSGDWRPMAPTWFSAHGVNASVARRLDHYDSIGPTFVNRPGLPLPRRMIAASVEEPMADQPAPVIVHQHFAAPAPAGPVLDPARVAAVAEAVQPGAHLAAPPTQPPPGGTNAGGGASDGETESEGESNDERQRLEQLEERVGKIEDAIGQIIDMLNQPMAAAAELPPAE